MLQHANEDVEKMILGNKCDMADKRQVPRQKGEEVLGCCHCHYVSTNQCAPVFSSLLSAVCMLTVFRASVR